MEVDKEDDFQLSCNPELSCIDECDWRPPRYQTLFDLIKFSAIKLDLFVLLVDSGVGLMKLKTYTQGKLAAVRDQ